jgi:hypothetical protein
MSKSKKPAKIAFKNKAEEQAARAAARLKNYVVVRKDDARVAKFTHPEGGDGFSLENAQIKAIPVHPEQPVYGIITVAEYEFIASHPEPITHQAAVNLFAAENPASSQE